MTQRYRFDDRRHNTPPDNGLVHYGAGLRSSCCGVTDPNRREVSSSALIGVTCPECLKMRKK